MTNKGPHEGFPEPAITLFGHTHLQPHDFSHGHRPSRHGARPGAPLGTRGRRHRRPTATSWRGPRSHPLRQRPPQHLQPKRLLHPTRLGHRHHRTHPSTTIILMPRVKRERAPSPESGGGPARGEEHLVCGFPYIIVINTFQIAKRPQ